MSNVVGVRTIKINLKDFIESLLFAHSSDDNDEVQILEIKFETVFSNSSDKVKNQILFFIDNYKVVRDNKILSNYFKKFTM